MHNHSHHGEASHNHVHTSNKKLLMISFILISSFMFIEFIGGIYTNSLALISDAAHMLSDSMAILLSLLAFHFGEKAVNQHKTYGYKRLEILATFINALALVLIAIYIVYEAFMRLNNPQPIMGGYMFVIAGIGLLINIIVAWLLTFGDIDQNLNMKSVFLHVLGDLLGSVGAIAAALGIIFWDLTILDLIISIFISFIVSYGGIRLLIQSINILMESTPEHINIEEIKDFFKQFEMVKSVQDLHIWNINSDFTVLTAHLTVEEDVSHNECLHILEQQLNQKFAITHITIQLETDCSEHHLHCN